MAGVRHNINLLVIIIVILLISFFSYAHLFEKAAQIGEKKENQAQTQIKNQPSKKSAKILFLGDLMFDRYIREIAQKKGNGYIFQKISDRLKNADLVVANLEGPITDNSSESIGTTVGEKGHFIFTFDKSICNTLDDNNIKLVNIGNNHILNFGQSGLVETKNNLTSESINYFGDMGENIIHVSNINGYKIGFVNYNQFSPGSLARTLENIKNLKNQSDLVVVYTHWGIEYQAHSNKSISDLGHQFIDFGADLIIGSHPHVVEEKEEYKEHWIYYSLGNFVFDQYFSPETKKGLAVEMTVSIDKRMEFKDIPLILDNNGQTRFNTL
jgi:gamma-polyglutamate biosynthesis protein CapA